MVPGLVLLPILLGGIAFAVPSNLIRPWLLPVAGFIHLFLTLKVLGTPELSTISPWLILDPAGRLVLFLVSVLFFVCSFYSVGYLRYRAERSNRVFCACLLASLGTMSLVTCSHHLGLMWVAIEATALSTAPLIYFNRTPRSIEATWKYMLVGSVGIALALLGSFFLAYSSLHPGLESSLLFEDLLANAPKLSKPWLHASFVLMLVGYGTKMGLSPMHTWKPDAYGEAPGVVGALLSGGVTSCAFLTILRINSICAAAGESAYTSTMLVFMGLLAMATAGVFIVGQRDIKRMLAYSSVEHMGILVLGLGIGTPALFGTLLHMLNNGFAKGVLFLSAGNIHRAFNSTSTGEISGTVARLPVSGVLFTMGFFAITGSPPFGPFISQFAILNGALSTGHFLTAGLYLVLLLTVFIGMGAVILPVIQGQSRQESKMTAFREDVWTCLPTLVLMGLVLLLGLFIPGPLNSLLTDAVEYLEVKP